MNEVPPPLPTEFKDRKTCLVIFGILTLLGGLLCALLVPLMLWSQSMTAHAANGTPPPHAGSMVFAVFIYGGLAVAQIWLGIGSIMARRWARSLLLIFSWSVLIVGVISLAFMAAMLPQFMAGMSSVQSGGHPALPESAKWGILIFTGAFLRVIFLIIPAIWAFFYGSKHVKATCEARDPVERWTDRCPLPVIALSLISAFGVLSMLGTAVTLHGVIPFFGIFLSGLPGTVFYVVFAGIMGYGAWAVYRLDLRGWWVLFAIMCIMPISGAVTYWHHDVMELYKSAGYSAEEMARIQQFNFFKGGRIIWFTLLGAVPWIGFLLYVKKFFRRAG